MCCVEVSFSICPETNGTSEYFAIILWAGKSQECTPGCNIRMVSGSSGKDLTCQPTRKGRLPKTGVRAATSADLRAKTCQ